MRIAKLILLYVASFPVDVFVGWPMVILVRLLWGQGMRISRGVLSCELRPGSFPLTPGAWPKGFYLVNRAAAAGGAYPVMWGGTCVSHGAFFAPDIRSTPGQRVGTTEAHEYHHVRQSEAAALHSFALAVVLTTVLAFVAPVSAALAVGGAVWFLGTPMATWAAWATSWLRSDSRGLYRGSVTEVAAYAVGAAHDLRLEPDVESSNDGVTW